MTIGKRSKYYIASESWTKRPAWAFEISVEKLSSSSEVTLLCEKPTGSGDYYELCVPADFLTRNLQHFHVRKDRGNISLFLSAEAHDRFVEKRGAGNVAFGQFVRAAEPA